MERAFLMGRAPLSAREALLISPLRLAYVGDAVHGLLVRTEMIFQGGKARAMHNGAVRSVNAVAQAKALERVEGMLTEEESDVVRRGRNAHAHHGAPRSANPADYARSTGLEALFGFLYLTGRMDRLGEIYAATHASREEEPCPHVP